MPVESRAPVSCALAIATLISACGGAGGPPQADIPVSEGDGILLARMTSWPDGGVDMTVRLEDPQGVPMAGDRTGDLVFTWHGSTDAVPVSVRRTRPDESSGHLAVLVLPGTSEAAHAELVSALSDLVGRRPAGERIALYRWGDRIDQLANFTTDRTELTRILGQVPVRTPGATLAPPKVALQVAAYETRRVGNDRDRGLRAVIIAGAELPGPAADSAGQSVIVQWAVDGATEQDLDTMGRGRVVPWQDHGGVAGALQEAERRIDSFRDAFYDIALCGLPAEGRAARVTLASDVGHLTVNIPGGPPEDRSAGDAGGSVPRCDASAILSGPRPYPDTIELLFTPEQRAVYDQRTGANQKDDFDLSVRFWDGGQVVAARAHLRGKGSLGCERRNYTLDLATDTPRYLLPGSATDEFYVLSMCMDNRYVKAYTVYHLLGTVGLFPLEFRFVELVLDGETRGVYLLLEKPKEALVHDNARVRAVVRRRYNPDATLADVKYSSTTVEATDMAYHAQLDTLAVLAGDQLSAAMDAAMDTRAYMTLLAMNSLLQNGDHVDETWLISTERMRKDGSVGEWYSFMGWDPDDVFNGCHYGGTYAFQDEFTLSYCAEAELDDMILGDPVMYARYVDVLDQLILGITDEVFQQTVDDTRADLIAYIQRPGVAAAMVELVQANPLASDPAVAQAEIEAELDLLVSRFQSRRQLLRSRVDTYRAQQ